MAAFGAALLTTAAQKVAGTMVFKTFLASFAFNFAMGLALKALTPKPSISGANRGYQVNTSGSALDHQIIYGKVRVGGAIVYDEATGDTNQYLHRIVAVSGHEINSFDRIYINDEYIDVTDIPTTGEDKGNIPLVYSSDGSTTSDRYDGKLRINLHLGTPDQAADSDLVAESDGLWTSEHRLRGIAYMYIRMEFDADVYPDGIPTFTAEVKGKKVYDPNSETTAWSDNPALCLRDYLSSTGYGLGEVDANIDDTLVNSAVSVCNQTNTIAGTTRYTCNGAFTTNVTPYDVIDNLLSSMGGTLWYAQGKWRMKPAYWTAPVLDLNEDNLRSGINVSTRHSRRDNFNAVRGTFRGAESNWQTTDYPEVTSPASVVADNNQKSIADVDLPFTDNSIEARRIARIALDSNRQQLTVTAAFSLSALQVQVGDNIRVTNDRFGWVNKEFQVLSWSFGLTDGLDLQVNLTLRETAESVYDEVDDGAAYERDNTNLPDAFGGLAVADLVASGGGRIQGDGTFINSAILSWTAATSSFVSFYEIQWKALVDSSYSSTTTPETTIEISPLVDGVEYEFKVRAVSINGVKGAFSTVNFTGGGDTTAPGLPTSITAQGGFRYITINWTNPADADLKHVEIWENDTNTTSGASLVGVSGGSEFIRSNLNVDQTKYYFLKSVDYSDNKSAFTSGVSATTTFIDDPDFENGVYSLFTEQGLYAIEDVTSLPPSGSFEGQKVFNRTDGKLYQWTGSVWEQVVGGAEDFSDLTGAIAGAQIPDGLIDTLKLADDAVTNAKIAVSAVQGDVIAAGAITNTKIGSDAVTTAKLANNAVTSDIISAGAITETKISNNAITTPKISAGAVTASEIATGSITSNEIAANTIAAGNIAAGAITSSELAANSVTATQIAANAVTASEIAAGSITSNEIAADTIAAGNIAAGAITSDEIAANAITSAKITAGAILGDKIAANAITGDKIGANEITGNKIEGQTITGDKIVANTITGGLLATSGIITNSAQITDAIITNAKIANISADKITAGTIAAERFIGAGIAHVGATAVNISAELGTTNLSASISGLQSGTRLIGIAGVSGYKTSSNTKRSFTTTASLSGAGSSGSVSTINGVEDNNGVAIGGWLGAVVSGVTTSTGTATLSVTISRISASGAGGNTAFKGSIIILGVQG